MPQRRSSRIAIGRNVLADVGYLKQDGSMEGARALR